MSTAELQCSVVRLSLLFSVSQQFTLLHNCPCKTEALSGPVFRTAISTTCSSSSCAFKVSMLAHLLTSLAELTILQLFICLSPSSWLVLTWLSNGNILADSNDRGSRGNSLARLGSLKRRVI